MVAAIGALLMILGLVPLLDLGGAGGAVIRRLTSRNLGTLAPGYAADPTGLKLYALLLLALGAAVVGIGVAAAAPILGAVAILLGVIVFGVASVVIIAGEVRVYRSLPKRPPADPPA